MSASAALVSPTQPASAAEASVSESTQPSPGAVIEAGTGRIPYPLAGAEKPSASCEQLPSSLPEPTSKDAVASTSSAPEQPASKPETKAPASADAQAAATAVQPTRRSARHARASSGTQMTVHVPADAGAEEAAGIALESPPAPVRGAARTSAIIDTATAATPASDARKARGRSPAGVPDSVASRRRRSRECEGGIAPASAPLILRRSARAGVKSPCASAPEQAPAERSRRSAFDSGRSAPPSQTVPGSVPAPEPASAQQALRRSARAALRTPGASAPEQASAERCKCSAADVGPSASAPQTVPDSVPARVQRSRRRTGETAEGMGQGSTLPVKCSSAVATMQATGSADTPAKRSRCSANDVEQSAPEPQTVPDSVSARMERSRRTAKIATQASTQASGKCSNAIVASATVTAQALAEGFTQAVLSPASGHGEGPMPALAPGWQSTHAAAGSDAAVAAAQATASAAAGQALPAAAGASSAPSCPSAPKQAGGLGCSKCRYVPKGCKKCRAKPQQPTQDQGGGSKVDKAVARTAAPAAQLQQESMGQAAPDSKESAHEPGVDMVQVGRTSPSLCLPLQQCNVTCMVDFLI